MKKSYAVPITIIVLIIIGITHTILTNAAKIEKKKLETEIFNQNILDGKKEGEKIYSNELISMINKVSEINRKNKEIDIENDYEKVDINIKFKNDEYIAGREGSQRYVELELEQIKNKNNEEFTYIFKDSEFIIKKVEYNDKYRIKKIVCVEQ